MTRGDTRNLPLWLAVTAALVISCRSDLTIPTSSLAVASVTIDSAPTQLERGTAQTLAATARDTSGHVVSTPFAWQSSVDSVAAFQLNGRLVANDTGVTVITASALGVASRGLPIHVVWLGAAHIAAINWSPPNAATPGATVSESLSVSVTNLAGGAAAGSLVSFTVTSGGGTISPLLSTVGPSGIVFAQWILGPAAGPNSVTAAVAESDSATVTPWVTNNPVSFSVRTYAALAVVQGDTQTAPILAPLPIAPSVRLVDSSGRPRAGVPIMFTPTGDGRVVNAVASTGVNGVASPGTWTLGDVPGNEQLVVTVESARLLMNATATGTVVDYMPNQVFAGEFSTCALGPDLQASCFGEEPQIGGGDTVSKFTPTLTQGGIHFNTLAGGTTHFCGTATTLSIYCWGVNALADTSGVTVTTNVPSRLAGNTAWLQVSPGGQHNCALASDQTAYCWGSDASGQLGDNFAVTQRFVPQPVFGGFQFTATAAGGSHTCGIATDSAAFCWGLNTSGQVGDSTITNRGSPTAVAGGIKFKTIGAGASFTCGLAVGGTGYCWGSIFGGGLTPQSYSGAPTFNSLSVGGAHACALDANGSAYCWGDNTYGQLGDSTTTARGQPTPVAGGLRFIMISAGLEHTCGITISGAVACWGRNQNGELGFSTPAPTVQLTPRYVILQAHP